MKSILSKEKLQINLTLVVFLVSLLIFNAAFFNLFNSNRVSKFKSNAENIRESLSKDDIEVEGILNKLNTNSPFFAQKNG
jgi:hypothetical protein